MKKLYTLAYKGFLFLIFSYGFIAKGQTVPTSDSLALVALYNATDGDNWTRNDNWLTGQVNTWFGINVWQGNVNLVDLWDNNLNGVVPSEIGNLSQLKYLYLGYNHLSGTLPPEIGNLVNLKQLNVRNNELNGEIPEEITDLPVLDSVALEYNHFTGIDDGLIYTPNLILGLSNNNFTFEDIIRYSYFGITSYYPQDSIGQDITLYLTEGNSFTIDLDIDDTVSSNKYIWFKDGAAIDTTNINTFIIPVLTRTDAGIYTCQVTNPVVPDLTLSSHSYTLEVLELPDQSVSAQDSLVLVALYEATNGAAWVKKDNWFTGPVENWHGITIKNQRVTGISLSQNKLRGTIPNELLQLDSLRSADFSYNYLTEVPDFSEVPTGLPGGLNIMHNLLTFQYIVPNAKLSNVIYSPQKIFIQDDPVVSLPVGASYIIDAGIDEEVTNSVYRWTRKDNIYVGTTNTNKITLSDLQLNDGISYQCTVTNPDADQLTLYISKIVDLKVYVPSGVTTTDSLALVDLFNSTNGTQWKKNAGWLTSPVATWYGVIVNNNRVTNLKLNSNNLIGIFPSSLGNLTQLTELDLSLNKISGEIPSSIENLIKLRELKLSVNKLTGQLPENIKKLTDLRVLDIGANQFSGPIPSEIKYLTNLERFIAYSAGFSGVIPTEIKYLTQLTDLNLSGNQLEDSISTDLSVLTNLERLDLSRNKLTGKIPVELADLNHLFILNLGWNELTGKIPEELADLNQLSSLYLGNNKLTGEIPEELTNLYQLFSLDVSRNKLTKIPNSFWGLNQLNINYNNLSFDDIIPYKNNDFLEFEYLPQNKVSEDTTIYYVGNTYTINLNIDHELSDNQYVWYKDNQAIDTTANNSISIFSSGKYKCTITNPRVSDLTLYTAIFDISIEDPYATVMSQDSLALVALYNATDGKNWTRKDNWLTGPVNTWEGIKVSQKRVSNIDLWDNNLKGSLPAEIGDLSELIYLYLGNNQLFGMLPAEIGNLVNLKHLNVKSNELGGNIPEEITDLPVLDSVALEHNHFTGISHDLAYTSNLTIGLGSNNFTFEDILYYSYYGITSYSPQDSIGQDTTIYITEGEDFTLEMPIDDTVSNNKYVWIKNNYERMDSTNVNWYKLSKSSIYEPENAVYTCEVTNPDAPYLTLYSKKITLVVMSEQNITFDSLANRTFEDPNIALTASSSSGLPIDFSIEQGQDSVVIFVNNSTLQIVGTGEVTIKASQEGNENYLAATPVFRRFTVEKADQVIFFDSLENKTFGDGSVQLITNSSAGLPVSYHIAEGENKVVIWKNDSTLEIVGGGIVEIQALQPGNKNYIQAPPVSRTFTVNKAEQVITFDTLENKVFGDPKIPLTAASSSGLPINFTITQGQDSVVTFVNDTTLQIVGTGEITIKASQEGNENYLVATPVYRSFVVEKAAQLITFNALENKIFGEGPVKIIVTVSSGLPINFEAEGPVVIEDDSMIITGAGQVAITASQEGNINYKAASSVERSFTVAKANQSITFDAVSDKMLGDESFTINAMATSGLEINFAVSGPAVLEGNVLSLTDTGTVAITASQNGNENYFPAENITRTFSVTDEEKEVEADSVYFLSGNIMNLANEPVSAGEIILFHLDSTNGWTKLAQQPLINNIFHFDSLAEGTYTLLAKAADTTYLPTYFGHHLLLAEATPITLQHALTEQDIILFPKPSGTLQGNATITGTLLLNEAGEGNRLLNDESTPLSGVSVFLIEKETGNLIAYDVTDANGTFNFSELAAGQYQLLADHEGLISNSTENVITVNYDTDELAVVAKIADKLDIVSVEQTNEVTGLHNDILADDPGFKIYPTLIENEFTIDFTLSVWQGGTVIVSDLSGKQLETKKMDGKKLHFDLSDIRAGLYLVTLKTNQNIAVAKVIKQ